MSPLRMRLAGGLAACICAGAAVAFAAPAAARPDPLDAAVPVPAARHQSAFDRYRPFGETAVGDWKAANDTVGRIGGWRAYAREAASPPAAAAPTPAPSATPAPHDEPHRHPQGPAPAGAGR